MLCIVSLSPDTVACSMLLMLPDSSKIRRLNTFFTIVVYILLVIVLRSSKSFTLYTPERSNICQTPTLFSFNFIILANAKVKPLFTIIKIY